METIAVDYTQQSEDYRRVEQAIHFLEQNWAQQPGLDEIANAVGLSEYHFQRLFTRWAGISPKRFLQFLTKEHAKELLEDSENILEVSYQAGLSGPGRLHDLFVSCEAVTPGEYKSKGAGLIIQYGLHPSPFGDCLIAQTDRGICQLSFIDDGDRDKVLFDLRINWQAARLIHDDGATRQILDRIFISKGSEVAPPLSLFISGTNFQIKVWEALMCIPAGRLVTYEDIATAIKSPKAARAVGNAVAKNPIAKLIPCHRVIRKMGEFGKYRWGSARKKAILGWEMAHL
jgi:AraC family transcriptional regulator, regulatory protein of adaptative response / methylated-DNA-[protein]-cysteine methyltransferase